MFEKAARYIVTYPIRITIAFIIISCILAFQLIHLRADFTPQNIFNKNDPDYKFYSKFIEKFGTDDSLLVFLIRGEEIFDSRGSAILNELTQVIDALPEVKNTRSLCNIPEIRNLGKDEFSAVPILEVPPEKITEFEQLRNRAVENRLFRRLYISTDGKAAAVSTELVADIKNIDQIKLVIEKMEDIVAEISSRYPEYEILMGGIPFIRVDIIRVLLKDQIKFLPLVMFVFIVISYLTFQNIQGVIIPGVTALFISIWGLGILHLCGGEINVLTNSIPVLVMIIGIADSIHLLVRYDEEIQKGRSRKEAVYHAVQHIGAACFFTSFTTAIAFASLAISSNDMLSSFGIYSSLGILSAYAVTMTGMPMLLLKWGRTYEQISEHKNKTYERLSIVLEYCANICIQHKLILFISGLLIVVFSFFGALRTGMSNSLFEFYKEDSPVYQSNQAIEESLAGISPYVISFKGDIDLFKDPAFLNKISILQKTIEKDPLVGKTLSIADIVQQVHEAFLEEGETGNIGQLTQEDIADYLFLVEGELERLVDFDFSWGVIDVRLKSRDSDTMEQHFLMVNDLIRLQFPENENDIKINVSGISVFAYRSIDNLMSDMMKSIFMAIFIVFIVIALEFRSIPIALVSMMPNLIPVLFIYGIMGWLDINLELSTVVVFTISLGLAVDDSIHFLVRFHDEFFKDKDYANAVQRAFNGAGRAIVYTTVILVLGLMVLTVSSLPPMVRFACLTAGTMISALIADLFVLPACIIIFKPEIKALGKDKLLSINNGFPAN